MFHILVIQNTRTEVARKSLSTLHLNTETAVTALTRILPGFFTVEKNRDSSPFRQQGLLSG
ncbi:hypothetical protein J7297_04313 [Nakaseomyces glabratus]|nr:hypothetical protein J7296_04396 [Nakaseomyces glabratus]KAH7582693.1 hypothetical protein J7297_04313 [Nakaseomyces glabratus]